MHLFVELSFAAPSTNRVIGFQGRLQSSTGAVVPDGHYNIQFRIYQGGTGAAVGNPNGTLVWSETYTNNGANQAIKVRNGIFSVNLGSINPFGESVDWDHETLWLSMNVAGRDNNCSTFGGANCAADGEMLPMKQITASPYALNAGALGGKTADNFIQLSQGVQTDSAVGSSIFLNKTGSGNHIQLQNAGVDALSIGQGGDLLFGSGANKSITIADSASSLAGRQLLIAAGNGGSGSGSAGGQLVLRGGSAGGTNGNGGDVTIDAGASTGSGSGGSIAIGTSNATEINVGNDSSTTSIRGSFLASNITLGDNTSSTTGQLNLASGSGFVGTISSLGITANRNYTLPDESGTLCVQGSPNCGFILTNPLAAQTGNLWLSGGGTFGGNLTIQTSSNSTGALAVNNSSGQLVLGVDTQNQRINIGSSNSTATLLVLDTKTTAGDPEGFSGAMYYNEDRGKFRCYENDAWEDCLSNTKGVPVNKTSNYTADYGDFVIANSSSGAFTVNLPEPRAGAVISVKKVNAGNNIIVTCQTSQIDNLGSVTLSTQWVSQDFYSDGTQWYRV